MAIKTIVVFFNGEEDELGALHAAFNLAQRFSSHVRCLHLAPDPMAYASVYGEGVLVSAAIVDAVKKQAEERRVKAECLFHEVAGRYKVEMMTEDLPMHHASASFYHQAGRIQELVATEGRLADMVVVTRTATQQNASYETALSTALFATARPVLMVPKEAGQSATAPERSIAVGWSGSRESAVALHAALPLMAQAEQVNIITVRKSSEPADLNGDRQLMRYLKLHGIEARHHIVEKGGREAGESILAKAGELGATMLAMGAYGHSRLREMVLGGVTEHVYRHAKIPVLMAH